MRTTRVMILTQTTPMSMQTIWLDPDGKLLPTNCYMELRAAVTRWSKCLAKRQESHHIKAEILNASDKKSPPSENTLTDDVTAIAAGNDGKSL